MPRLLEHHDELGLPWDQWADGRVHRLVKGRDFLRSTDAVEEAQGNAARRLGLVARSVTETRFGKTAFWFQFVDYEVRLGEPCGCGSSNLRRVSQRYADCASCGATVALLIKGRDGKRGDADEQIDDAVLALFTHAPGTATAAAGNGPKRTGAGRGSRNGEPRGPRQRRRRFTNLSLATADGTRYWGCGTGPGGERCLVVVEPPEPGSLDQGVAASWAVPLDPFRSVLDVERLERLEAVVEPESLDLPLGSARLAELAGAVLFEAGATPKGQTYVGYGRAADGGEELLLTVRYPLRDGERVDDPEHPGEPKHAVRAAPLEPFRELLDTGALYERDPDVRLP